MVKNTNKLEFVDMETSKTRMKEKTVLNIIKSGEILASRNIPGEMAILITNLNWLSLIFALQQSEIDSGTCKLRNGKKRKETKRNGKKKNEKKTRRKVTKRNEKKRNVKKRKQNSEKRNETKVKEKNRT